tara:strand:- start:811 stop:1104 length:294 start_codon:yes stop_codon:yes gene_type:complete
MVQAGAGKKKEVAKVLKGVNKFLKKHKLLSKGAKIAVKVAPKKYKKSIGVAGDVAEMLGYGKMRGRGVSLPGGAYGQGLRLAGQGKKRKRKKRVKKK